MTDSAKTNIFETGDFAEPQRRTYTRGDHEIRFYHWPKPAAPRYLLVHGIGMGHRTFDRLIEAMLPHAEVIAVDLPGFGQSPEPEVALSIADTGRLLGDAVRETFGESVTAIGHSMGAQVVVELAVAQPDLVERVVLLAPAVNAAERNVPRQTLRLLQDFIEGKPLFVVLRGLIEYGKTGPRWFLKKLAPTLDHHIEDMLPNVLQPAFVLCGNRDRVTPTEWCLTVARILPQSEFSVLDDIGHEAMIARGGEVAARVLQW